VLDTNSLIYALNGQVKIPLNHYLVSIITEIELLSYSQLTKHEDEVIRAMLDQFKGISLTNTIKDRTISIRKKFRLKLPDSIIVATAVEFNATLITSDKQLLNLDIVKTIELKSLSKL
jgi:predicted nucleic acid-binding protein